MITNSVTFSAFLSDDESKEIIRQSNLILLENHDFFEEICDVVLESKKIGDKRVNFKDNDIKANELSFTLDNVIFSFWDLTYNIKSDNNEIVRIFNFVVNYPDGKTKQQRRAEKINR
jgi:hypothetical protein